MLQRSNEIHKNDPPDKNRNILTIDKFRESLTQGNFKNFVTLHHTDASRYKYPLPMMDTNILQIGSPEQVAKSIDFLLDAHKNWITGQVISADGGMVNLK